MAYVAYEDGCYVIRENTGFSRILAGLVIATSTDVSEIQNVTRDVNNYSLNHATYEAMNPLWVAEYYYGAEPIRAPSGYACVWEEYLSGSSSSLSDAVEKIRSASYQYQRAAYIASAEGGVAYAKDYFAHYLPQTQQLPTPTGLVATNITSNSARLAWNAVDNANGYKVELRQGVGAGRNTRSLTPSWKGGMA